MPHFTKLEMAVIDAICRQHPEVADALRTQLATARVTARENTGAGMIVSWDTAETAPPFPRPMWNFGDVRSTNCGVELSFFVMTSSDNKSEGLEGYIAGEGNDTSGVDLTTVPFSPLLAAYEPG